MTTRREKQRNATSDQIKALALEQMRTEGTAGLSLRRVADELGVTVGALYRYYASRDALITALLVDSFVALGDALRQTDARFPASDYRDRFYAMLIDYRAWALEHSVRFHLMYGNPIPGYEAPRETTVPAAARVFVPIMRCLDAALAHGVITPALPAVPDAAIESHIMQVSNEFRDLIDQPLHHPLALYLAVDAWTRTHGAVMLELHGHTPAITGDPAIMYRTQIDHLLRWLGF